MFLFIRNIICFFLFAVAVFVVNGQQRYVFSNLSLEDGLSQITVLSILQDREGYMWFGTRNGLNRYDGYGFVHYQHYAEDPQSISDNHILCMTEGEPGTLWIGTNNGLNRLDIPSNTFTHYFSLPEQPSSLDHNTVSALCYDPDGNLWVGTRNGLSQFDPLSDAFVRIDVGGLLHGEQVNAIVRHGDNLYLGTTTEGLIIYNIHTHVHRQYATTVEAPYRLLHDYIRTILVDRHGTLWAGTHHNGVCYLKQGEVSFRVIGTTDGLTNDYVRCLTQSPDGKIVVGTFNGLSVIDPQDGTIEPYSTYGTAKGNLSHYSVFSIYFDRSETLWVGTYSGGVDCAHRYGHQFQFYNPALFIDDYFGILGAILETEEFIYFASEGMGILEWNKVDGTFQLYSNVSGAEGERSPNIIKVLFRDGKRLLCGTNVGTVYSFDLKTKKFELLFSLSEEDPIYYMDRNSKGELMLGTVTDPVGLVIGQQDHFRMKNGKQQTFANVRCLLEFDTDRYLIGTRNEGLYDFNRASGELIRYKAAREPGASGQLPDNYVSAVFRDRLGQIWIGTFGGGFSRFDPATGNFENYDTKDGLLSDHVCSMVEDDSGNLWISTISGISGFNPEERRFRNYTVHNGIGINEFTPHSGLMLSNGKVAFSGNNGFVVFDPSALTENPYIPPVVLRNLFLGNDLVLPGDETGILSRQLGDQREIVLRHDQANISIEYSALNYLFPERNQYRYILEGFDEQWNEAGTRRMAYYTNITPGKYRFVVHGSNNDGVWNPLPATIGITVLAPFWKTGWAYLLYFLLGAGVVAFVIRYFTVRKRLENDIKLKQAEARAQAEFHEARDKLFTNFSHELRTPLTLIMSPLEDMIEREDSFSPKVKNNMEMMRGNAHRLLRLVNNLMDFQKRQSGKLQLNLTGSDFIDFSREMVDAFSELARSRDVSLRFRTNTGTLSWWFDRNLMEKVYFNFLSNAMKNVPDGGQVEVALTVKNRDELHRDIPSAGSLFQAADVRYVLLEISDSGKGIPAAERENIFIPFYQVGQNEHSASGTGLGLSLSKSIIEMHQGTVWAETAPAGGALFRVVLPIDPGMYVEADAEPSADFIDSESRNMSSDAAVSPGTENLAADLPGKKYTVLIVEDNPDVRSYLHSQLSPVYHTIEAANGADAFDKAINHLPDLVITDRMMPKMDGIEMSVKLKEDLRTSHIPIIMITARAMSADIKKGYESGADDYIAKPFNSSVLLARIDNLIRSRESLKAIYGKRFDLDTLGVQVTSVDERFMNKVYEILQQNLANPEFNLDKFSQQVGMSRANLYRKLKAVTNLSPNEFIRNFRLERAANLLKESRLPVSDVYVAVGFSSHAYFSNCFKTLYGITPSDYASRDTESSC